MSDLDELDVGFGDRAFALGARPRHGGGLAAPAKRADGFSLVRRYSIALRKYGQ
ncbi:hypothetical protein [Nannocystis pusilla]|uniref:hypothetical protein n=1 Tax=Nannocystis pusilla TaxID=889268 RepID=UPI003BF26661